MTAEAAPTPMARYHHGDLRRALLSVTGALLEEVGPEQLSLREVARRAGVSSRAPYRHFPSKEALLSAVAVAGFGDLRAALRIAGEATAAGERVPDQAAAYVGFAQARPALYRLMFSYRIADAEPDLAQAKAATQAMLMQVITGAAPPGADIAARAMGCWALVHGLSVLLQEGLLADVDENNSRVAVKRVVREFL